MNRTQQQQRILAGASISMACVRHACAAKRPDFCRWIKQTGTGSQG